MKRRAAPTWLHATLLALLLLAAQAAGLAHRVAHAPGTATAAAQQAWAPDHEHGSAECRLVDQLAHADLLCGGAPPATVVLRHATAAPAPALRSIAAGPAAAYLARAPPRG
jgi:hypothetical protein